MNENKTIFKSKHKTIFASVRLAAPSNEELKWHSAYVKRTTLLLHILFSPQFVLSDGPRKPPFPPFALEKIKNRAQVHRNPFFSSPSGQKWSFSLSLQFHFCAFKVGNRNSLSKRHRVYPRDCRNEWWMESSADSFFYVWCHRLIYIVIHLFIQKAIIK